MKRATFLVVIGLSMFLATTSFAGTLTLGAKVWQSWWNSAIGDFAARAADRSLEEFFNYYGSTADFKSKTHQGEGILGGPMISYQTDDSLWSFSLAWMGFSSFSQDADLDATVDGFLYSADYVLDLDRNEIDFAISRKINDRLRAFIGYKHQKMKYRYKLKDAGGEVPIYEAEATMTMPSIGIAYTQPLWNRFFAGVQGGLILVNGTLGYREQLWPDEGYGGYQNFDNTIGLNGELSFSWVITDKIVVQGGYRLQWMQLQAEFGGGLNIDDTDLVHGFYLSTLFMFNL